MTRIENFLVCLRATNTQEQGVSAHGILNAIMPEYVPGLFSFSVVFTLLDIDNDKEHVFSVKMLNPEGNEIAAIGPATVPPVKDESDLPNEYKGINFSVVWNNLDFKTSGLYKIKVFYDDAEIGNKDIFVRGKNQ